MKVNALLCDKSENALNMLKYLEKIYLEDLDGPTGKSLKCI
jgi:hypothetical protein